MCVIVYAIITHKKPLYRFSLKFIRGVKPCENILSLVKIF